MELTCRELSSEAASSWAKMFALIDDVPGSELINCRLGSLVCARVNLLCWWKAFKSLAGVATQEFACCSSRSMRLWIALKVASSVSFKALCSFGALAHDDCKLSSRRLSSWIKSTGLSWIGFASSSSRNPIDWWPPFAYIWVECNFVLVSIGLVVQFLVIKYELGWCACVNYYAIEAFDCSNLLACFTVTFLIATRST